MILTRPRTFRRRPIPMIENRVIVVKNDPRLTVTPLEERLAINGGLQPFALLTSRGAMIAQVQMPERSYPSERIRFHWMIGTFISRDLGLTWQRVEHRPGQNELYMEGGALEISDGTVILQDTYVTPAGPGRGEGLLQLFDLTLNRAEGPFTMKFDLPGVKFDGHDDGGNPHRAIRLHRRILELPGGDLLTTIYGWGQGDITPSTYMPKMMRSRCMLLRSRDRGRNWCLVSTIAVDPTIGSEGFGEPDLVRLSQGPRVGRLLCFMRTGRELYTCHSDDEGVTWSRPQPEQFGIVDINQTEEWETFFAGTPGWHDYHRELAGAFVDPNVIELRNGVLACAIGVRVPEKMCWVNPRHPRNGNYVAFSFDHGATWSHIVQLTSGVCTTHYMNILEIRPNRLQVMYDVGGTWDHGYWDGTQGRYTAIRELDLEFPTLR